MPNQTITSPAAEVDYDGITHRLAQLENGEFVLEGLVKAGASEVFQWCRNLRERPAEMISQNGTVLVVYANADGSRTIEQYGRVGGEHLEIMLSPKEFCLDECLQHLRANGFRGMEDLRQFRCFED